jgi:hypothetical protein
MTRGRQANTAHVVTGATAPPGRKPYKQAAPDAVLAGILQREDNDLSATGQIRQSQDWITSTGHLLTLWAAAVRQTLHPGIDAQIKARLTSHQALRYDREHTRKVLQQRLRAAQLAGHDLAALIAQITNAPLDEARSITSVLHHRLQQLNLPASVTYEVSWAQRTPRGTPAVAHELAAGLDQRARALGEQLAGSSEPWLASHLGVLAAAASPALREDYTRRAAAAAAYREAAGITDPQQAVSLLPHRGSPELEHLRLAVVRALEIRDEAAIAHGTPRDKPKALTRAADRAQATALPDISCQLRPTAQAGHVDQLLAQASAAASRIAAERASRETKAEYAARIEREGAHEQLERFQTAQYDAEIEP